MRKKVICVDFDKTLCDSKYPQCGPEMPNAKESLQRLKDMGYYIIISSCRSCAWIHEDYDNSGHDDIFTKPSFMNMKKWLDSKGFPYDVIDDGTKGKVFADWYVDDKALHYDNNWTQIIEFLESRQ